MGVTTDLISAELFFFIDEKFKSFANSPRDPNKGAVNESFRKERLNKRTRPAAGYTVNKF